MTLLALILLAIVAGALIVALDRMHARQAADHQAHRAELAELLQRIQSPRAAVAEHHAAVTVPGPPENAMPMTDMEIAATEHHVDPRAAAEREALIAHIEAVENGQQSILEPLPFA